MNWPMPMGPQAHNQASATQSVAGGPGSVDSNNNPFAPFFSEIRAIVKDELEQALVSKSHLQEDRLITIEEAAKLLSVSEDWLYRHGKKLPFTRKIHHKMLRFSYQGLQKYISQTRR
jgi:predicted DNA-binding transcriptional regulator AlpA